MDIYKIDTFGCSFYFLKGESSGFYLPSEPRVFGVRLSVALDSDFSLDFFGKEQVFMPDLRRAFQLFLTRVRGYPAGEYEIKTPLGNEILPVLEGGACGGDIGRLEFLEKRQSLKLPSGGVEFSAVKSPVGIYLVVFCDSVTTFDIARLGRELCLAYCGELPRGALALTLGSGKRIFRSYMSDGKCADSCAFAVAGFCLRSFDSSSEQALHLEGDGVFGEVKIAGSKAAVFSGGEGAFRIFT